MKRFCDHSCLLTRTTGNKVAATRPVLVESILIDFVQQIFIKTFNLKVVAISNLAAECIDRSGEAAKLRQGFTFLRMFKK